MAELPERIDRFEVRGLLGEGGQGRVYLAWDPSARREVALKLLPRRDERARRELEACSRLRHPGIVAVHEVLELGADALILVMERVEGETLLERVRQGGALSADEAVQVGREIAAALEHAHQQGVLHRDLKPHNVMLTPEGRVRVLDFGLARLVDRESLTRTGELLGTPAYMAPEQAAGEKGALGPATDVYGLGATLFYALSEQRPFSQKGASLLYALLHDSPPRLRSLRGEVPEHLEALVARCLEKAPGRRPVSPAAVVAALQAQGSERTGKGVIAFLVLLGLVLGVGPGILLAVLALDGGPGGRIVRSSPTPLGARRSAARAAPEGQPGSEALARARGSRGLDRYRALRSWLGEFAGHELRPQVLEELRVACDVPLARINRLPLVDLRLSWTADGLFVAGTSLRRDTILARRLDLGEGVGDEVAAPGTGFEKVDCLAVRDGWLAAGVSSSAPGDSLRVGCAVVVCRLDGEGGARPRPVLSEVSALVLGSSGGFVAGIRPHSRAAPQLLVGGRRDGAAPEQLVDWPGTVDLLAWGSRPGQVYAFATREEKATGPSRFFQTVHELSLQPGAARLSQRENVDQVETYGRVRDLVLLDEERGLLGMSSGTIRGFDRATLRIEEIPVLVEPDAIGRSAHPNCGVLRLAVVDGERLLSLARNNEARSAGGELRLWDLASGGVLRRWPIEAREPTDLALSPDGLLVAVGVEDDERENGRVLIYGLPPP